jgi:hypothetical protein
VPDSSSVPGKSSETPPVSSPKRHQPAKKEEDLEILPISGDTSGYYGVMAFVKICNNDIEEGGKVRIKKADVENLWKEEGSAGVLKDYPRREEGELEVKEPLKTIKVTEAIDSGSKWVRFYCKKSIKNEGGGERIRFLLLSEGKCLRLYPTDKTIKGDYQCQMKKGEDGEYCLKVSKALSVKEIIIDKDADSYFRIEK